MSVRGLASFSRLARAPWALAAPAAFVALAGCQGAPASSAASSTPSSSAVSAAAAPTSVSIARVEARTVPTHLALTGTLLADEESRIAPVMPGRVVEVLVDRGSVVTEGQPLVRLRDVDYRLQSRSARAQLEQARARLGIAAGARPPSPEDTPEVRSARASLALAEDTLRRAEELAQRGVFTQAQLDEARTRAQQARDQVTSADQNVRGAIAALGAAEAQLSIASTAVSESIVRAPFAGEIASRNVSPGEFVAQQSTLVTLVRTNPLRLELQVPQERVANIRVDQAVSLQVDAYPGELFEGHVRYVSAAVDRATRAMVVEAVVSNDDGRLRPGMFVTARIALGGEDEVAVVPAIALSTTAGVHRVFVVSGDHVEERVVTVLDRTDTEIVVGSGIRGGETVATSALDRLRDGAPVTTSASETASATPQPVTGG